MPVRFKGTCLCVGLTLSVVCHVLPTNVEARPATNTELQERVRDIVEKHVLPRFNRLAVETTALQKQASKYCESNAPQQSNRQWKELNSSFSQTVAAWAAVQHLRFGPLIAHGRLQRMVLWPDPRAITWRHLRRALRDRNDELLDPDSLKQHSVALQGLTALEYLLNKKIPTGPNATPADNYKCALVTAITKNTQATAEEVLKNWLGPDGWAKRIMTPGPENKNFVNDKESAVMFVKAMLTGIQLIRDHQLDPLLRAATKIEAAQSQENNWPANLPRDLRTLPFYKSGLSERFLQSSVATLEELSQLLHLQVFTPENKSWLSSWLPTAFAQLKSGTKTLAIPTKIRPSTNSLTVANLRKMRFYAGGLTGAYAKHLAPAAGLTIGFNELDGD